MNNIKTIRINEGRFELDQVIIILTIENEIVRTAKTKAEFFYTTHTRYGNFDGQGFVEYLNRIYGKDSCWLIQYDNEFTVET